MSSALADRACAPKPKGHDAAYPVNASLLTLFARIMLFYSRPQFSRVSAGAYTLTERPCWMPTSYSGPRTSVLGTTPVAETTKSQPTTAPFVSLPHTGQLSPLGFFLSCSSMMLSNSHENCMSSPGFRRSGWSSSCPRSFWRSGATQ